MKANSTSYKSDDWCNLKWSKWLDVTDDYSFLKEVPPLGGFYRVRAKGIDELIYIDQTKRDLRKRLSELFKNVFSEFIPWNSPHPAAPPLWAYRTEDGYKIEVSYAVWEVTDKDRQNALDEMLTSYRLETGESTLCNHGRLHPYWAKRSNRGSGKNVRRLRKPRSYPSYPPCKENPTSHSQSWLGFQWSRPVELTNAVISKTAGIYRLTDLNDEVCYVGYASNLQSRFKTHAKKLREEHLSVSWVKLSGLAKHQLDEIETDLRGAFYREHRVSPRLQYERSKNPFKDYHQELCRSFRLIMDALNNDRRNDDLRKKLASYNYRMQPTGELHIILEAITPRVKISKLSELFRECSKTIVENNLPESLFKMLRKLRKSFEQFCDDAKAEFEKSSSSPKSVAKFTNQLGEFGEFTQSMTISRSTRQRKASQQKRRRGRPRKGPSEKEIAIYKHWKRAKGILYSRIKDFQEKEYPDLTEKEVNRIFDKVRQHYRRQNT
ncbi:MAG: GIY-YIG nuclease family protein [Planctomycetaceae bacterium]